MNNIDYSDRSARAIRHGKIFEEWIEQFLPGIERSSDNVVDFYLLGAPLEAKSCQVEVVDNTQKGPHTKSGRFYLKDHQHQHLVQNNGRYLLGVMEGDEVVRTRIVLASHISPAFEGCKTLTWRTVFRALGACC